MGEVIEFSTGGGSARGYLARPDGPAPGVIVVQEWWGLVPQIKRTCDRLADAGFVALAPDLFGGEMCEHTEMDKANELMTSLSIPDAADDMLGAVDALLADEGTTGESVGVVGFCMGGMLTLVLAAAGGDRIGVAVPYYGAPLGDGAPDWSGLTATVRGHFAEEDDFFPWSAIEALGAELRDAGKDVEFTLHPGTGHGFANEENPLGNWDEAAADAAWRATLAVLRERLD